MPLALAQLQPGAPFCTQARHGEEMLPLNKVRLIPITMHMRDLETVKRMHFYLGENAFVRLKCIYAST